MSNRYRMEGASSPAEQVGFTGAWQELLALTISPIISRQIVNERRQPYTHEHAMARRWWTLPPGIALPLSDGGTWWLVFAGRPGGPNGPDVRDAVLHCPPTGRIVGDVEFHIRANDWFVHHHHTDARYNRVILHVVLICDSPIPTRRQDGTNIPCCPLAELPRPFPRHVTWPCQPIMAALNKEERARLLRVAGLLRFEQKIDRFVELLHAAAPIGSFSAYDACLIPALAEALGYGRDRAFFHAAGLHLLGVPAPVPEPLGRVPDPPPLDAERLHLLSHFVTDWRERGIWETVRPALLECSTDKALSTLRTLFKPLSIARTDILLCNVVLSFAAAVGHLENNPQLIEQATRLYLEHPGLPSNHVTRAMCEQLGLRGEPSGACRQQGLQYIYQQTCREKRCDRCTVGRRNI